MTVPAEPAAAGPGTGTGEVLALSLGAAVPIAIADMTGWSDQERLHASRGLADVICEHGDVLLYGGGGERRQRKDCAAAFAALVRALAIGAYQPGGITFAGSHWCAAGCDCPTAHQQGRAIHTGRCRCEQAAS